MTRALRTVANRSIPTTAVPQKSVCSCGHCGCPVGPSLEQAFLADDQRMARVDQRKQQQRLPGVALQALTRVLHKAVELRGWFTARLSIPNRWPSASSDWRATVSGLPLPSLKPKLMVGAMGWIFAASGHSLATATPAKAGAAAAVRDWVRCADRRRPPSPAAGSATHRLCIGHRQRRHAQCQQQFDRQPFQRRNARDIRRRIRRPPGQRAQQRRQRQRHQQTAAQRIVRRSECRRHQ